MVIGDSEQGTTKESRRQAILEAALACFASKGFTETTMEDIRKLSGASTGSIYHHFENKEMLARALYLEGRSSLHAALSASLCANSLREGIEGLVYAYLDWFEQHADLGQYLLQAGESEYLSAYVKVLRQKTRTALPAENLSGRLLQWLAPYISDGSVVNLPQSLYLPLVIGPSREFVRIWLRTRQPEEIQEAREPLAKAAWLVITAHVSP
ncbi:MAG: TetR/AcrR family transcriptional regulator [Chloroflexi bacterium]|nr:TetR/AcrR family transcriptional regulator [Chloroflexota bacterium]